MPVDSPLFAQSIRPFDFLEYGGEDVAWDEEVLVEDLIQEAGGAGEAEANEEAGGEEEEQREVTSDSSEDKKLKIIVLCGLLYAGKSEFSTALQEYYPDYVRCNEEDFYERGEEAILALHSLQKGKNAVIDCANLNAKKRSPWIRLARSMLNVEVQAFHFDCPLEICKERLLKKADTTEDLEVANQVLMEFHRNFQRPNHQEGFDKIVYVHSTDFAADVPTKEEIDIIMANAEQASYHQALESRTVIFNSWTGAGGGWRERAQKSKEVPRDQTPKVVQKLGIRWRHLNL